MSNTLQTIPAEQATSLQPFSAFGNISMFEDVQRMATMLCSSSIVPETYRGKEHLGDCVIALEIANRIGASVLAVMQNLYIVYGRPAWSSQFLISCVNASRKFSPLRYRMTGEKGADSWGCVAWATDKTGEKLESPEVTLAMAKAEGWYQKNGSKWKTMPELMLRYRVATLFARLYAPELTMGIQTDDEVIDIAPVVTDAAPTTSRPIFALPPVLDGGEPTASLDPLPRSVNYLKGLRGLMKLGAVSEGELLDYCRATFAWDDSLASLEEVATVAPSKLSSVYDDWGNVLAGVNKLKKGAAK